MTLTLARGPSHPDRSPDYGFQIVAPLGPDGRLDAVLWQKTRDLCRVRRFWRGAPKRYGRLVRRAGEGGALWLIDYDDRTAEDDAPGDRLGTHAFVEGEHVSIREAGDERRHTFRVARVTRL